MAGHGQEAGRSLLVRQNPGHLGILSVPGTSKETPPHVLPVLIWQGPRRVEAITSIFL